jgi:hypothetical protein
MGTKPKKGPATVFRLVAATALLVVGLVLMVIPGPGIPFVLAGLALAGKDFPFARRAQEKIRQWVDGIKRARDRRRAEKPAETDG